MNAGMVPRRPRRARHLMPTGLARRGELVAAGAVAIVLLHLLLAPLTLVLAAGFTLTSRATRWRLGWLLGPAAAGLAWTLAVGPDQALAGFAAGPESVLRHLGVTGAAGHPARLLAAFTGIGGWRPRQLPLALPAAAAEAAVLGWLDWLHTDEWAAPPPRPGAVAALRSAVAARAVRSGRVLTADGCALGTATATGAVAELRWPEIAGGVLVTGADEQEVTLASLQVVHAALRRRKPVIVLAGRRDAAVARALAAACRATGTPLLDPGTGTGTGGTGGNALAARSAADASGLWGRGRGGQAAAPVRAGAESKDVDPDRDEAGPEPVDLGQVIRGRLAVLLPADSPELAARACAGLISLAADLRRIGVDGDALVWAPGGERLPGPALAPLLRDGADAGLPVLVGTTSPSAAAELGELAGTILIRRLADPGLAARLARRTGTRLLPPAAAAQLGNVPAGPAAVPPVGFPAFAAAPAPGPAAGSAAELVPSPVIPARGLLSLGRTEFVLAVSAPRTRLVALGRLVPSALPRPASDQETGPRQHARLHPANRPGPEAGP